LTSGTYAYVATQTNGVWGTFSHVPGLNEASTGNSASVNSVSCPTAGNCTAAGFFTSSGSRTFVATQTNGIWGTFSEIPGLRASETNSESRLSDISCSSPGNCTVAGNRYLSIGGSQISQVLVATQSNGVWSTYSDIPSLNNTNSQTSSMVFSLDCATAGHCAVAGSYSSPSARAFVAVQHNGRWLNYSDISGLNVFPISVATRLSCTSKGFCLVGGIYGVDELDDDAFVASLRIPVQSSDSSLASITTPTPLKQAFSSSQLSYTVTVPNNTKSFTVTPVASEANAVITVNSQVASSGASVTVPLVVGANSIEIVVTAHDGVSKTSYGIVVTRSLGTVKVKKSLSAKALLATADSIVPSGAKVKIDVNKSSRQRCVVSGTTLRALATGNCTVKVTVTPKKGKAVSRNVTVIVTGTPTVTRRISATAAAIAEHAKIEVETGSKISLKVAKSSAKNCRVSGAKVVGLKTGTCRITVTVTSAAGAITSKTVNLKVA
jgi:hypothetical protein